MQASFTIKQFVIKRYILQCLFFVAAWIALGILLLSFDAHPSETVTWIAISIFVGGFVGLLLLSRYLATLVCQYTLSENGLTQTWGKTLFPPTNKQYLWKEVASYKVDEDANGTLIRLSFKDKTSLTIAHSDSINDEFSQFKDNLFSSIEGYNASGAEAAHMPLITRSPSLYETKTAKVVAVIGGILLIVLAVAQWERGIGWSSVNWWKTIWLYAVGIPMIIRVFSKHPEKYK
ncbi:hypothetical protein BH09BAC1_BH09BAC1_12350 [soil metagenome]